MMQVADGQKVVALPCNNYAELINVSSTLDWLQAAGFCQSSVWSRGWFAGLAPGAAGSAAGTLPGHYLTRHNKSMVCGTNVPSEQGHATVIPSHLCGLYVVTP